MAISPPSDIVLDVAKAANPVTLAAARAKLAEKAAAVATRVADASGFTEVAAPLGRRVAATREAEPFQKFEAMVLKNFVETMLPSEAGEVYGKGVAGDMWKSLLAEKIADTMAARGGIGIGQRMLADRYQEGEKTQSVGPVSNSPERAETDTQNLLSTALVEQIERRMTQALSNNDPGTTGGDSL